MNEAVRLPCEHEDWKAQANVIRLTDSEDGPVTGWTVELTLNCVACGCPMIWRGLGFGSSPHQPTVSADLGEARLPCEPRRGLPYVAEDRA